MKRRNSDEVIYFKEILIDHMQENHPLVAMSESEIMFRACQAAETLHRDDLTTSQVMEIVFDILLDGYQTDMEFCAGNRTLAS